MRTIDKTEITVGLRLTKKEHERYKERGKGRYLRQFLQDDDLIEEITKAILDKMGQQPLITKQAVKEFVDENNTLGAVSDMFGFGD